MWDKEFEIARTAAIEAGKAIMQIYEGCDYCIEYKEDNSPLTRADKQSNNIIVNMLAEKFPSYAILSEEMKDNKERLDNQLVFIVDPLDGTKEFIKKNGQFTVNIALSCDNRTVMGVIYVPVTEELFYASKGSGAYRVKDGITERLRVTDRKNKLRMVMSGSHGSEQEDNIKKQYPVTECIKMGSSLKGCLVASGAADIYYRFNPTMEWDTAAMQCIVEEAGGIFRQMDGSEMTYNREDNVNRKGFYVVNCKENIFV